MTEKADNRRSHSPTSSSSDEADAETTNAAGPSRPVMVDCLRRAVPFTVRCESSFAHIEGGRKWYRFHLTLSSPAAITSVRFQLHESFGAGATETVTSPPFTITRLAWAESTVTLKVAFEGSAQLPVLSYHVRLFSRIPRKVPLSGIHVGETAPPLETNRDVDAHITVREADFFWLGHTIPTLDTRSAEPVDPQPFEAYLKSRIALLTAETEALGRSLLSNAVRTEELTKLQEDIDAIAARAALAKIP